MHRFVTARLGLPSMFWSVLALTLLVSIAVHVQTSVAGDPIVWHPAFTSVSATPSQSGRVSILLLITNDDPFGDEQARPWCDGELAQAFGEVTRDRPELREDLRFEFLPAGLPGKIVGGDKMSEQANAPARSVVMICDGRYRLRSFAVGVPDGNELWGLIEDAEECVSISPNRQHDRLELVKALAERSFGRLSPRWQKLFERMLVAAASELHPGDTEKPESAIESDTESPLAVRTTPGVRGDFVSLIDQISQFHLADMSLRFDLTDAEDKIRMAALEQHVQTRDAWCQAMTPFVAKIDVKDRWKSLTGKIWDQPVIDREEVSSELVRWFQASRENGTTVISIQVPVMIDGGSWPPVPSPDGVSSIDWADAHAKAIEFPLRTLDWSTLANLLIQSDAPEIDLRGPSPVRYVIFGEDDRPPVLFRSADPPGRMLGILKRAKSGLMLR